MSEELIQRGLGNHGLKFGDYEFYNIGSTTIRALRSFNIVPNKAFDRAVLSRKPDGLLIDRRARDDVKVILVIEHKSPQEFDTPQKKDSAIRQCVLNYCKPLEALIGIVTDGNEYIWINPQSDEVDFQQILREDEYPLQVPFAYGTPEEIDQTVALIETIITDISPTNSMLTKEKMQNPSALAERVWQTIWLASGENPDALY